MTDTTDEVETTELTVLNVPEDMASHPYQSLFMRLDPNHRVFLGEYVKHYNMSKAARAAGSEAKDPSNTGKKILEREDVRACLTAIEVYAAQNAGVSLTEHLRELAEIRDLAKEWKNPGAAVTAEVSRGKVAGYYIDRKMTLPAETMTDKDIAKQVVDIAKKAGTRITEEQVLAELKPEGTA